MVGIEPEIFLIGAMTTRPLEWSNPLKNRLVQSFFLFFLPVTPKIIPVRKSYSTLAKSE